MAHEFKVGDRVVLVRPSSPCYGIVAVVTSGPESVTLDDAAGYPDDWARHVGEDAYQIDLPRMDDPRLDGWSLHSDLEPYRDDGSEAIQWSEELRRLCGLKESMKS